MGRPRKEATPVDTGGETPEAEIRATEESPKSNDLDVSGLPKHELPGLLAKAKAAGDHVMVAAILKACS